MTRCSCILRVEQTIFYLMFIGPCIIVIAEEWKTNLMSLATLFHFLCAQYVSDINKSIIRSLRLCCWITTSVAFFLSSLCVGDLVWQVLSGSRFAGWSFSQPFYFISLLVLQPAKRAPLNYFHQISWKVMIQGGKIDTPPIFHILSHMIPVYTIAFCLFIIHFNIFTIYTSTFS